MARRKHREEKPAPSNRGRRDARGVFVIFERAGEDEPVAEETRAEDEPLARDDCDDDPAA